MLQKEKNGSDGMNDSDEKRRSRPRSRAGLYLVLGASLPAAAAGQAPYPFDEELRDLEHVTTFRDGRSIWLTWPASEAVLKYPGRQMP